MEKPITIGERGNEAKRQDFTAIEHDGTEWKGQQLETPASQPLETDRGFGRETIIRQYEIQLPEFLPKGVDRPKEDELLGHYRGQILAMLWKDGWEQVGDIKTVLKDNKFYIFVPAQLKTGGVLLDKALNLKEVLHGK